MKIPANAQDVSYDETLSSERIAAAIAITAHVCTTACITTCLEENVQLGGKKKKLYTWTETCSCKCGLTPCPVLQACFLLCLSLSLSGKAFRFFAERAPFQAALQAEAVCGKPRSRSVLGNIHAELLPRCLCI